MRHVVCSSSIYAPKTDVDSWLTEIEKEADVIALGHGPVTDRLREIRPETTLTQLDLRFGDWYRTLSGPETHYVLFVCRKPGTKVITDGMEILVSRLTKEGQSLEVRESPIPGRVCQLITNLDRYSLEVRRRTDYVRTRYMRLLFETEYELQTLARRIQKKLEAEDTDEHDSDEWVRGLQTYTAIENALKGVRGATAKQAG